MSDLYKLLRDRVEGNMTRELWEATYMCNPWRNSMKPGPYKSSTHGEIPLSVRARELLMAERNAAANAIAYHNWRHGDDALSRARGELAKYMSDLECALARGYRVPPRVMSIDLAKTGILAQLGDFLHTDGLLPMTPFNPNPLINQEKPMTEQKAETRAQQLQRASSEVVNATLSLDNLKQEIESAKLKVAVPDTVYVNCTNDQHNTANHVARLVKEQWETLRDEALHRAELRVWEAEAALTRLLGGEPTAPKPRKPRAAK